MSRKFALGFVAVAALTMVGVDYSTQAKNAGQSLSAFGPMGYAETVQERFDTLITRKGAHYAKLTEFLPAPKGEWTREIWTPRRGKALLDERDRLKSLDEFKDPTQEALETAFPEQWHYKPLGTKRGHTIIYTRGTELIEVTIKRNSKAKNKVQSVSDQVPMDGYEHVRFGYIRGIDYIESINWSQGVRVGAGKNSFRSIAAHIDGKVLIGVSALASSTSIKQVLAGIDVNGVITALNTENPLNGDVRASTLPQIERRAIDKSTVKRIQVNPQGKNRKDTNSGMKLMGKLF